MASVSLNQSIARVAAGAFGFFDSKNARSVRWFRQHLSKKEGCHDLAALTKMPPVHRGKVQNLVLVFPKTARIVSKRGRNFGSREEHHLHGAPLLGKIRQDSWVYLH